MSGHTPGPWGFEDSVNDFMVTAGRDANGAFVYVADPSYDPEHAKANARLIAAAPKLLEACRLLVDHLRFIRDNGAGLIAEGNDAVNAGLTAIAKAEGR